MEKSNIVLTNKSAKLIRTITIAPVMAFAALSILYVSKSELFGGLHQYILSVIFLTVLPVLAYPLQPYIPGFKEKGREGQRNLAIIMAVLGYLCSIVSATIFHAVRYVWIIYLTYLISGLGILFFNKFLKIRASGHACGVMGPVGILIYDIGTMALFGAVILIPVYWACIKMKRHTVPQLLWGTLIPIGALFISIFITNIKIF